MFFPVPFLLCDSCPLSFGVCPIGVIQKLLAFRRIPCFFIGSLLLYSVVFGRAACDLLCPIGAFQDLINWIGLRLGIKRVKLPNSKLKIVIPLALVLASLSGVIIFCKICISGLLFAGIPWRVLWIDTKLTHFFIIHLIVFVIILIMTLFAGRVWCKYLCPFMLVGLLNENKMLIKISLDEGRCTGCNLCLKNCPIGIERVEDISSSIDCIFLWYLYRNLPQ